MIQTLFLIGVLLHISAAALTTESRPEAHVSRHPEANTGEDNKDQQNKYDVILIMWVVATLTFLLHVAIFTIVFFMMRKNPEKDHIKRTMKTMPSENQMTSISPAEADSSADGGSVVYCPVSFTKTGMMQH